MHALTDFLLHVAGLDDGNSPWYLWWSGLFPALAITGSIGGFYLRHNCHGHGCWRWGRHHYEGTPWCSRHHPKRELLHHWRHGTQPPAEV